MAWRQRGDTLCIQLNKHLKYIFIAVLSLARAVACLQAGEPAAKVKMEPPDFTLFSQGKYVYEKNCLVCHGERGDGRGQMGLTMDIRPRDFRTGIFKYKSTGGDALPTTEDLLHTVSNGITGTAMPIFAHLPDKDRKAVVEYIKTFSSRWNHEKNYGPTLPRPTAPDWMDDGDKLKVHQAKGKELFVITCVPCHGPEGKGDGPNAAQLVDMWEHPIKPGNLRVERLRQGDESTDWFRVLTQGIAGTPMPTFSESLTEEQRWQIVAYLQQLRATPLEPGK